MIRLGRLMIDARYWREPLQTQHHKYPGGKPRTRRRFDWHYCLGNNVGPLRILWIYTRDKNGQPLGRTIEWLWLSKRVVV